MEISNKKQNKKKKLHFPFTSCPLSTTFVFSSGNQVQTLARSAALVLTALINKIFPQTEKLYPLPLLFSSILLCVTKCKGNKNSV